MDTLTKLELLKIAANIAISERQPSPLPLDVLTLSIYKKLIDTINEST